MHGFYSYCFFGKFCRDRDHDHSLKLEKCFCISRCINQEREMSLRSLGCLGFPMVSFAKIVRYHASTKVRLMDNALVTIYLKPIVLS